jgi:L-asparaginase / beta-aspartyl-peptidase
MSRKKLTSIAVHGGAGTMAKSLMTPEKQQAYLLALKTAVETAHHILANDGTAMDAVEAAVVSLENNSLFNAGKGAVFTNEGSHEMDASIMCGKTLMAGAVAGVRSIKNPVTLSRKVMEETEHVFLHGIGAEELARKCNLEFEAPDYFFDTFRHDQWIAIRDTDATQLDHVGEKKFGTVGAVALDTHGNLAAATSTGGMTNKRYNRIGDTPIIGAGTYANNNTCAISCTGHGEFFIRSVVAYDVSCLMEYKNFTLKQACEEVVKNKLVKLGGEGGLIALDKNGIPELCFNSEGMYRGYKTNDDETVCLIY